MIIRESEGTEFDFVPTRTQRENEPATRERSEIPTIVYGRRVLGISFGDTVEIFTGENGTSSQAGSRDRVVEPRRGLLLV